MTKSVNQSWAVSQKFRNRYGSTWADLDFFFKDRVYSNTFKSDPMNTNVGALQLEGMSLPFKYKDLIVYNKKARSTDSSVRYIRKICSRHKI